MFLHADISLILFGLVALTSAQNVIVKTQLGEIEGKGFTLYNGVTVNRWHAVPYVKPPVGKLRFEPPQPLDPWDGVLEAHTLGAACPQRAAGYLWFTHPGWSNFDENCLHMNIYAPADKANGPYPVLVNFHGGGYTSSSNIQYPGHYLAAKGVVVVVPNYRLSSLGFLTTEDKVVPGNMGIMDQVKALEFVRDNIAAFNGNPNDVTIGGQSAGAASSTIHMYLKESQGLFHRVIAESGSDLAPWAFNTPAQKPVNYARQVAKKHNCPTEDNFKMVECLRGVEATELATTGFECEPGYFCQSFAPVVDGIFITDETKRLRAGGHFAKVPLMSGQCSEDGSPYTAMLVPEANDHGFNRSEFQRILRNDLATIFEPLWPDKAEEAYQAMDFFYSPWPHIHDKETNRQAFNTMITDFGMGFSGDAHLKWQAKYVDDVYYYIFAYRSAKAAPLIPEWFGVPHNCELPYLWSWPLMQLDREIRRDAGITLDLIRWDETDIVWADYVQNLFANFIKHGNPTPTPVAGPKGEDVTWPTFDTQTYKYLHLAENEQTVKKEYKQQNHAFWQNYVEHVTGYDYEVEPRDERASTTSRKAHGLVPQEMMEKLADWMEEAVYNALMEQHAIIKDIETSK